MGEPFEHGRVGFITFRVHKTVAGAMAALEREGLIESRGPRRGSRIVGPGAAGVRSPC